MTVLCVWRFHIKGVVTLATRGGGNFFIWLGLDTTKMLGFILWKRHLHVTTPNLVWGFLVARTEMLACLFWGAATISPLKIYFHWICKRNARGKPFAVMLQNLKWLLCRRSKIFQSKYLKLCNEKMAESHITISAIHVPLVLCCVWFLDPYNLPMNQNLVAFNHVRSNYLHCTF